MFAGVNYFYFIRLSKEWHEPINCRLLKLWLKKCSDDSETANWLNANTKDCPKCHVMFFFDFIKIYDKRKL